MYKIPLKHSRTTLSGRACVCCTERCELAVSITVTALMTDEASTSPHRPAVCNSLQHQLCSPSKTPYPKDSFDVGPKTYPDVLFVAELISLESGCDQLSRGGLKMREWKMRYQPFSFLYRLLLPLRDISVISRLRTSIRFTRPIPRTKNIV